VLGDVDNTVHVEGYLLAVRAPVLVAEAVDVLAVVLRVEGVVAVRYVLLEGLILARGIRDLDLGHYNLARSSGRVELEKLAYPKVDIQVSGTAKFSIADLEGDGHLVLIVKLLVETFAAMGRELDVVAQHSLQQAGRQQQGGC
jgi:hypothetical protein